MPTRIKPPDMKGRLNRNFVSSDNILAQAALDMFARLIEILAERRIIDSTEIRELAEIARQHMRE
jgi:hypothetical protein